MQKGCKKETYFLSRAFKCANVASEKSETPIEQKPSKGQKQIERNIRVKYWPYTHYTSTSKVSECGSSSTYLE